MKKLVFTLMAVLSIVGFLYSKTVEEEINERKLYLELFPDDLEERYNLAYLYNLMNQLQDAESQYQYILTRDSLNADAWIGYLWSMNLQEKYQEVLSYEKKAIQLSDKNPSVLNMMAFSHGNLNRDYTSIYYYRQVLKDEKANETEKFLANKGIAGHYFWTGDYHRFDRINKDFNKFLPDEEKQNLIPIYLYLYSGIAYGQNHRKTDYLTFNQWLSLGALEMNLIVEDKKYESKQAKTNYSLKIDNKYFSVNISSQFHLIKNNQKNYHGHKDGYACQFSLSSPFYTYKSKLEPYISLAFFDYDTYTADMIGQAEAGAVFSTDYFTLGLSLSQSEYPKQHKAFTTDVLYNYSERLAIQFINGFGDNNAMISSSGQLFDELSSSRQFHQVNHYLYLKKLLISLSYNRSLMHKWTDSWMMSAGIRY